MTGARTTTRSELAGTRASRRDQRAAGLRGCVNRVPNVDAHDEETEHATDDEVRKVGLEPGAGVAAE